MNRIKCECCGKFMTPGTGTSWSQSWHYCMDGSPELEDPVHRCKKCTDKFGVPYTNCHNPENYQGVFR